MPDQVFRVKHVPRGHCLEYFGMKGTNPVGKGQVALRACDQNNDLQFFHPRNSNPGESGQCCTGFGVWDTDQCFDTVQPDGKIMTYVCDISGGNPTQFWSFDEASGKIMRDRKATGRDECLTAAYNQPTLQGASEGLRVVSCVTAPENEWATLDSKVPMETEIYRSLTAADD